MSAIKCYINWLVITNFRPFSLNTQTKLLLNNAYCYTTVKSVHDARLKLNEVYLIKMCCLRVVPLLKDKVLSKQDIQIMLVASKVYKQCVLNR